MSEVVLTDHSIDEPSTAHLHPLETIPQGSQSDGVLNGHDNHDVNVGAVYKSAVILTGVIVFSLVVCGFVTIGFLNMLSRDDSVPSATYAERATLRSAWPYPLLRPQVQPVGESPQLDPIPGKPAVMVREAQDAQLHGSNWVNGHNWVEDENGRRVGVSIPIEQAMELTLKRGLPVEERARPQILPPSGEAVALGAISPGETMFRQYQAEQEVKGVNAQSGVEEAAH